MPINIIFPESLPAPSSERWWLEHKTQIFRSPLSGQEQRIALNAARWRAELTFPYLQQEEARTLSAFSAQLQGAQKRFRYTPANNKNSNTGARWAEGAVPQVADLQDDPAHSLDANATASSKLTIDLLQSNEHHRIQQGDSFSLLSDDGEGSFHIVTTSWRPPTGGARFATLRIAPPLRFAPSQGSSVELIAPQAFMRLLDDRQARLQWLPGHIVDALTLQLVEAL